MAILSKLESNSKSKVNLRNNKKNRLNKKKDSDDDYESEIESVSTFDSDEDDDDESEDIGSQDSDDDEEEEEDEDEEDDGEEDILEVKKRFDIQKCLSKIFPSKYMDNKVKNTKKHLDENDKKIVKNKLIKNTKLNEKEESQKKSQKTYIKNVKSKDSKHKKSKDSDDDDSSDEEIKSKKICKSKHKKSKDSDDDDSSDEKIKSKKICKSKDSKHKKSKDVVEEEDDDSSDEDTSDDSDDEEEEIKSKKTGKSKEKLNIILNISGEDDDDDYDDDYFEDECLLYENEDENEECGSDDEKTFMKENYQEVDIPIDILNDKKIKKDKKDKKDKKNKKNKKDNKNADNDEDIENEIPLNREADYLELIDLKKHINEKLHKKPTSKILIKTFDKCQKEINKLVKSARFENTKKYHKLIHSDRKKTDEIEYFKKKLSNKEQMNIMNDLKEINKHINIEKPYRLTLLQSKMPANFKAVAMQKLNLLRSMDPMDPEYFKIKNWVDTFMKIPFGVYKSLSIKMDDGLDLCNEYIVNAKKTLDDCVYGLDDAKMQIMQLLGQWISNPGALGTAIAIKGPMGTGKTTIVKEGISKILGREFAFIALGGAGDSSFLEGHSYTYEGSTWGKIVQIIIDSKCMNPVIYFDELDKISDTARGQEIIGILTHLTDTSQNSQYHDKYFSEIDFDLSKCLFIFSYNDENLVNPILKDRMYRIQTKGYDCKEKIVIARNYLLPKIREQVNFLEKDIIITDEIIQYIVQTEGFTKKEDGVRNLKRCLEIIYTKLNLFRLVKPEVNLFGKQLDLEVSFPFTVTKKVVDLFIKVDEDQKQSLLAMYV